MSKLQAPFVEQHLRRQSNLVTPVAFSLDLGTSPTTIYTGITGKFFLIRTLACCNTSGAAVDFTLTKDTSTWVDAVSIASGNTDRTLEVNGVLFADGEDLAGFGSATGLTVFGWGLQIEGGDAWIL